MIVDHKCHDPAAIGAAILADVTHTKEIEEEIKIKLGAKTAKVWKEVKLFLYPKTCEVYISQVTKYSALHHNMMEMILCIFS